MKLILRFRIPVEQGNRAEADGTLSAALRSLVEKTSPASRC